MADVAVYILAEEHWGSDVAETSRIGLYSTRELAEAVAAELNRLRVKTVHDAENYSYLVEEDKLFFGKLDLQKADEMIATPGRSWRWWPQLAEEFAEVEQTT